LVDDAFQVFHDNSPSIMIIAAQPKQLPVFCAWNQKTENQTKALQAKTSQDKK